MQLQSRALVDPGRQRSHTAAVRSRFNIYHGKGRAIHPHSDESTLLPIQYIVYETLVDGIRSAVHSRDFQGALLTDYQLNGEEYHIVFAMWYSKINHIYFLSSLGQYSTRDFHRGMQEFKLANEYRLRIKLAPIHPEGLLDLQEKLSRSNLSGGNVCLIDDTIGNGC